MKHFLFFPLCPGLGPELRSGLVSSEGRSLSGKLLGVSLPYGGPNLKKGHWGLSLPFAVSFL